MSEQNDVADLISYILANVVILLCGAALVCMLAAN
jgi:hypothetical protein